VITTEGHRSNKNDERIVEENDIKIRQLQGDSG
jgi:hypothetical protein